MEGGGGGEERSALGGGLVLNNDPSFKSWVRGGGGRYEGGKAVRS